MDGGWQLNEDYKKSRDEVYDSHSYDSKNKMVHLFVECCKDLTTNEKYGKKFDYLTAFDKSLLKAGDVVQVDRDKKEKWVIDYIEGDVFHCKNDDGLIESFPSTMVGIFNGNFKNIFKPDCMFVFDYIHSKIEYSTVSFSGFYMMFSDHFLIKPEDLFKLISVYKKLELLKELGINSEQDVRNRMVDDNESKFLSTILGYFTSGSSNPLF